MAVTAGGGRQVELFLDAGVACVIATHNYIDDGQAALFAYEFYANLLVDPDKNTFQQAFDRAGSLTLMGENRSARSFDIDDSKDDQKMQTGWDWGLFTKDSELSTNWTYTKLQEGCGETVTPTASMDFITKAKLEGLQTRWQRLYQRHSAIEEQSDLETRAKERLRMKYILEQNRDELSKVEKEIKDLQSN